MLKKIITLAQDYIDILFIQQKLTFDSWLESHNSKEKRFYYLATPFLVNKKNLSANKNLAPSFVITTENEKLDIFKKLSVQHSVSEEEWHCIYEHQIWNIYEKSGNSCMFSNLNEARMLSYAREVATQKITKSKAKKNIHSGTTLYHVDITLWVKGSLRGSQIVYNKYIYQGIEEAMGHALTDERFSPITEEELTLLRIEIILISTLPVPLPFSDKRKNVIHHTKAYHINSGEKQGWYLPSVHNCINFHSLDHMVHSLVHEKLRVPLSSKLLTSLVTHETRSYIESYNHSKALSMDGPIAYEKADKEKSGSLFITRCFSYFTAVRLQFGSIPAILDPSSLKKKDDVVRKMFFLYSLLISKDLYETIDQYQECLEDEINSFFLLFEEKQLHQIPTIALAYAFFVSKELQSKSLQEKIQAYIHTKKTDNEDVITRSWVAKIYHCLFIESANPQYLSIYKESVLSIKKEFMQKIKRKEEVDLVLYAELPLLLHKLYVITKNKQYKKSSEEITSLYLSYQNNNGAFPISTHNHYYYVRGTSKILEVLSQLPYTDSSSIRRALSWCLQFQYTIENTFHITETHVPIIIGGVRHDYYNREIWIDATSHILLALHYQNQQRVQS